MRKYLLLTTALVFVGGSAWAATSEYTCPEGSASTLHCFTCGSDCTMTLDTSTGHAVVEGTGEMETTGTVDAYSGTNAWNKYNKYFKDVEIKEGITSVGFHAFHGVEMESIIIPNSVIKIEANAFCDATKLKNITIPDSVTSIGMSAFIRTYALEELVIPDSVTTMGYFVFYQSNLRNLTIPDSLALKNIHPEGANPNILDTFRSNYLTTVTCAGGGDTAKCDALLKQGGKNIQSTSRPNYRLDENGKIVERYQYDEQGQLIATYRYDEQGELIATYGYDNNGKQYLLTADGKLSLNNADGSTYIYNKDGNLVGIKGKKIYTVEEAEAVTAHGDKFHVSLTYK